MESKNIWNHTVFYDTYHFKNKPELREFLRDNNLERLLSHIKEKVFVVCGGDGTALSAIWENYESWIPILPINFWTIWFLLNDKDYIKENSQYVEREYPLFEVTYNWKKQWVFFNEINIYPRTWKVLEFDVSNEEDNWRLPPLKWDWLLIATPAWSTWHNKSYGWVILSHTSKKLIITPKWDMLEWKSKIREGTGTILINNFWRKPEVGINLDWNMIAKTKDWDDISIEIQKSKQTVKILIEESYFPLWDEKVLEGQGFRKF